MGKRPLVTALAALLSVGLFAFGCGPDGSQTEDAGGGDTGVDTGTMENDAGGGGDADAGECQSCVDDSFVAEEAPSCDDSNPPDRCSKDPSSFDQWGPASALTQLEFPQEPPDECCFDMNGDGKTDNALASLFKTLAGLGDININAEIAKNIVANDPYDDDLILLLEHQKLEQIGQSNEFLINLFLGEYADMAAQNYLTKKDDACNFDNEMCETVSETGHSFNIDPSTFDDGVQPQAQVPHATFPEGSNLEAGPGKVVIDISSSSLGDISLTINGATIEGVVNKSKSDLSDGGDGVVIEEDGKLGGYVLTKDIIALVDSLMSDCDCLGLSENQDAITYPTKGDDSETDLKPPSCDENSGEECKVGCTQAVRDAIDNDQCSDASGICGFAGTVCDNLSIVTETSDLDIDGDGTKDAFSAGAYISATGANIAGVASGN